MTQPHPKKTAWNSITGISAIRIADKKKLTNEQWLQIRRKGIGGSDIAKVCGLSHFGTNVDVFLEKTGRRTVKDNPHMYFGRKFEPVIAECFQELHPTTNVKQVHAILQHPDHSFCMCNIDRLIEVPKSANGILEIKYTTWADIFEEGLPRDYYCQVQWMLGCTGLRWAKFACFISPKNELVDGDVIHFDEEFFAFMLERARDFWNNNVLKDVSPIPHQKPSDLEAHAKLWPSLDPNNWADVSPEMADLLANYEKLKQTTNEAKKALDEIKSRLLFLMGDKKYAKTDTSKITIVSKKSNSFASKKFKEDHPDLFNQYSVQIESRYPLIKSIK